MNLIQVTICFAGVLICGAYAIEYSHSYAHHIQDHHLGGGGGGGGGDYHQSHHEDEHHHYDHHEPINYKFGYAVKDPHTGDDKEAWEHRHGDQVKGSYSLVEPDGSKRIVDYSADKHNGFSATVKTIGHHGHHVEHFPSHGH